MILYTPWWYHWSLERCSTYQLDMDRKLPQCQDYRLRHFDIRSYRTWLLCNQFHSILKHFRTRIKNFKKVHNNHICRFSMTMICKKRILWCSYAMTGYEWAIYLTIGAGTWEAASRYRALSTVLTWSGCARIYFAEVATKTYGTICFKNTSF